MGGIVPVTTLPTMELIEAQEKTDDLEDTFTFSDIPGHFKHLYLIGNCRNDSTNLDHVDLRFNNDTGTNYADSWDWFGYAAVGGGGSASSSFVNIGSMSDDWDSDRFGSFWTWIPYYTFAHDKCTLSKAWRSDDDSTAQVVLTASGYWNNTATVTRIDVLARTYDFKSGSHVELYGMR